MANTGHEWSAWAFAKDALGGNWDNTTTIADEGTETSNAIIELTGKSACEVSIHTLADDTEADGGPATIYILGAQDSIEGAESSAAGSPWAFQMIPEEDVSINKRFSINPADYGDFKLAIKNECGVLLTTTIEYRTASIPVAS